MREAQNCRCAAVIGYVEPYPTHSISSQYASFALKPFERRASTFPTPPLAVFGLATSPFDQAAYFAGSIASIAQPSRAT
jgi:hypothetical protein